jgi:hypothetical protein
LPRCSAVRLGSRAPRASPSGARRQWRSPGW